MNLNCISTIYACSRDGMCESGEFDSRVLDSLKNFDLNSAEVKQQFGKLNLTSLMLLFVRLSLG